MNCIVVNQLIWGENVVDYRFKFGIPTVQSAWNLVLSQILVWKLAVLGGTYPPLGDFVAAVLN